MSRWAAAPRRGGGKQLVLLNVQGLTPCKLGRLIVWVREAGFSGMVLTETKSAADPETMLRTLAGEGALWPGARFFHTPGSGHTEGVAIVLGPGFGGQRPALVTLPDAARGRVLRVDLDFGGREVALVGVYAPATPSARAAFFTDILQPCLPGDGAPTVLGGDFNCVLEASDCVFGEGGMPANTNSRLTGGAQLRSVMHLHSLVDAMPTPPPGTFTHWSVPACSGARLDRWLVTAGQRAGLRTTAAASVLPSAGSCHSDHLPVLLSLKVIAGGGPGTGDDAFPTGRGLRSFPGRLFAVPELVDALGAFVEVEARAVLSAGPDEDVAELWREAKGRLLERGWSIWREHRAKRLHEVRVAEREERAARAAVASTEGPGGQTAAAEVWHARSRGVRQAWAQLVECTLHAAQVAEHMLSDQSTYYFHRRASPATGSQDTVIKRLKRPGRGAADPPGLVDMAADKDEIQRGLKLILRFSATVS